MQTIEAVFQSRFEVTQFWASRRYSVHEMSNGSLLADLVTDHLSDVFAPFLPTRHNLRVLNDGCVEACRLLERLRREPDFSVPEETLFAAFKSCSIDGVRDLSNPGIPKRFFRSTG
jgi:hypothetical protein